ncbi:ActS/PrrB/RegB family redox-sensitive histidine kinase [Desertibaculum subflavum]|uniref:ActS/PrrB/RegB family redox-sensitive histidine kinase n=1 Tax=Desertibaculum subflavum TaxID=2268458 RepID=UPI000E673ADC
MVSAALARRFGLRRARLVATRPPGARLHTLIVLRWLAIIGQTLAILFVHFGLDFRLPLGLCLATVGVLVAVNLVSFTLFPTSHRLTDRGAAAFLALDIVQLAVLLYLTGGLGNPFSLLMLVPVTISATILSLASTVVLGALAVLATLLLAEFHLPLPWGEGGLALPGLYLAGVAAALLLGLGFISVYTWRVAAEARRMSDALASTQIALAREQRLSALGGLAAAAAHELGTPLGTITLVANELAREVPAGDPISDDVRLLVSEAQRCRDILANLARRPDPEDPFPELPIGALVEEAFGPHHRGSIELAIRIHGSGPQPLAPRLPEILHGIGNLAENAFDFARARIDVAIDWDDERVAVTIADDGPGLSSDMLGALGEPYVTSRPEDGGMGLGVFIAKTLLGHTGAQVAFGNRPGGGCEATVSWARGMLEKGEKKETETA